MYSQHGQSNTFQKAFAVVSREDNISQKFVCFMAEFEYHLEPKFSEDYN